MVDELSVHVEERGRVLVITIDRPRARNALDAAVARAVNDAVDRLDATAALRAGVLTGAGGNFSAGMDLKAFLRGETPEIPGRGLCGITRRTPAKPLIAAVEGWALAGGCELVLACDLVVAASDARLGVPEVTRALVAAGGGALSLADRIPRAVALELLLTGDPIDAQRAYEVGLVNRVTEPGTALDVAVRLAERIGRNGPAAVRGTKQIALGAADQPPADRSAWHDRIVGEVLGSPDAREGAAAFAEKREPRWADDA